MRILWGPDIESGQGLRPQFWGQGLTGRRKAALVCMSGIKVPGQCVYRVREEESSNAACVLQQDEDSAKFERRAVLATAGDCEGQRRTDLLCVI